MNQLPDPLPPWVLFVRSILEMRSSPELVEFFNEGIQHQDIFFQHPLLLEMLIRDIHTVLIALYTPVNSRNVLQSVIHQNNFVIERHSVLANDLNMFNSFLNFLCDGRSEFSLPPHLNGFKKCIYWVTTQNPNEMMRCLLFSSGHPYFLDAVNRINILNAAVQLCKGLSYFQYELDRLVSLKSGNPMTSAFSRSKFSNANHSGLRSIVEASLKSHIFKTSKTFEDEQYMIGVIENGGSYFVKVHDLVFFFRNRCHHKNDDIPPKDQLKPEELEREMSVLCPDLLHELFIFIEKWKSNPMRMMKVKAKFTDDRPYAPPGSVEGLKQGREAISLFDVMQFSAVC